MKTSNEWKRIEIICDIVNHDGEYDYTEVSISHDGGKGKTHVVRYNQVNEIMNVSLGEEIAKYINDNL